jgi:RRXRR protein
MQYVFVVDARRRPLMPCRPARARLLLKRGQAAVLRRYPFVIILKAAKPDAVVHRLRLKIDPGSQTTGLALMTTLPQTTATTEIPPTATCEQTAFVHPRPPTIRAQESGTVVWAGELTHRGDEVRQAILDRREARRSRRQRHTRYREARYENRTRPAGWLPPSLQSRVLNVVTWVDRVTRWCPIDAISFEAVRFDTQ